MGHLKKLSIKVQVTLWDIFLLCSSPHSDSSIPTCSDRHGYKATLCLMSWSQKWAVHPFRPGFVPTVPFWGDPGTVQQLGDWHRTHPSFCLPSYKQSEPFSTKLANCRHLYEPTEVTV